MPKAILELEMPESCCKCDLKDIHGACQVLSKRNGKEAYRPDKGRRSDCPLKLVDGEVE